MALSRQTPQKSSRESAKLLFCQWMQVAHQALQALLDHMGIDLRGRDIGMAEQRLDDTQVGAVVQQVAREGMTQHMRRDQPRRQAGGGGEFLQVAREMLPPRDGCFRRSGRADI